MRVIRKLEEIAMSLNTVFVLAMMVFVFYGVICRYGFRSPVRWVSEITEYMMVALTFLSVAYVQYHGLHVRVNFLIIHRSKHTQLIAGIITTLCALTIFAFVLKASSDFAIEALRSGYKSEEMGYPLFLPRLIAPVGSFLMCLQLLADLAQQIGMLSGLKTANKIGTQNRNEN